MLKFKLFFATFLFFFLTSCTNTFINNKDNSFEVNRKEELVKIALIGNYKISKETIIKDVSQFFNHTTDSRNCSVDNSPIIDIIDTFSYNITCQSNVKTRSSQLSDIDNISFYLIGISNVEKEKNKIVITSDDQRIGEILMMIDADSFESDAFDNPFMQIVFYGLENHIEQTIIIWNSITDANLNQERQQLIDITKDGNVIYTNWNNDWSYNKKECNTTVEWEQDGIYAEAIQDYYGNYIKRNNGDKYIAGCGAIAVAQILAYKKYPLNCTTNNYNKLVVCNWNGLKKNNGTRWNGIYNWDEITKKADATYLPYDYGNQVSALIFDVAEGINSTYDYENGKASTDSTLSNQASFLKSIGYNHNGVSFYDIENIKTSINQDCPVLTYGCATIHYRERRFLWKTWTETTGYSNGHFWVIDGYTKGSCIAKNVATGTETPITNKYFVHCNAGWGKSSVNGYYISEIFTMSNKAIRSSQGSDGDYVYNLKTITGISPAVK